MIILKKLLNEKYLGFGNQGRKKLPKPSRYVDPVQQAQDEYEMEIMSKKYDSDAWPGAQKDDVESGLIVSPRTQIDANVLINEFERAGLHAEWNAIEGYFFFKEEEELYDELEELISDILNRVNIFANIEGVWA